MTPTPAPTPTVSTAIGAPPVPFAVPSAAPAALPESGAPVSGDERVVDDLDQFFAALRQVVHDARAQLAVDDSQPGGVDHAPQSADPPDAARLAPSAGDVVLDRDPTVSTTPAFAASTELAPSNEELVASLQADRDVWRERAIAWRERAMGADMLVKALNAHMSDLQINLEDLRLAMRVRGNEGAAPPAPRTELRAPDVGWHELGAGPQE